MITVKIKETREGTLEFETQEEYDAWVADGEDLDSATCDEVSTNITHPDGSISGDYTDYPQSW
tara:strand:- start:799 stop:987 length:189 start_codon:yes stop_codon:yes gene_type:complete